MTSTQTVKCRICGHLVSQTGKGRPKEYHNNCHKFQKYLGAAHVHMQDIKWNKDEDTSRARRLLITMANAIPHKWHDVRDSKGRFA